MVVVVEVVIAAPLRHTCVRSNIVNLTNLFSNSVSTCTFCFPNADHVIILRRFDPLSCSLKRVHASMEVS